jgi:thiamine pyrophosphate-dependent acetolactate synthase large subunit-like protein
MNRLEAISVLVDTLSGNELLVHANGAMSRESCMCRDREANFYLLGSMGLASSVGLGVALHRPDRKVIILDGDGNLLMGLGNLALIGAVAPRNLVHLVLDNGVYGTTGNQPTVAGTTAFHRMAVMAGYRHGYLTGDREELETILTTCASQDGPILLQIMVSGDVPRAAQRIPYRAEEIKERFMKSLE